MILETAGLIWEVFFIRPGFYSFFDEDLKMAKHCPKCNFFNPYSAQICGECGHTLILPKTKEKRKKPDHLNLASRISWKSFGIEKVGKEARSPLVISLTLCLFAYGLILVVFSIGKWFKFAYGLGFVMLPAHLYPLLLGIFLGAFTIILAFGISLLKRWVVTWYFVWIGIQALALPLLLFGLWRPEWLTIKVAGVFSTVILVELIGIPFVLRLKKDKLLKSH
jgi:ribosomal protein L40E